MPNIAFIAAYQAVKKERFQLAAVCDYQHLHQGCFAAVGTACVTAFAVICWLLYRLHLHNSCLLVWDMIKTTATWAVQLIELDFIYHQYDYYAVQDMS